MAPEGSVCDMVGKTSVLGKISHPLSKDGKTAIIENDKLFHYVNVANNLCLSDSNSSLIE